MESLSCTDIEIQVIYLIEVPGECTQCTLWKVYIKEERLELVIMLFGG